MDRGQDLPWSTCPGLGSCQRKPWQGGAGAELYRTVPKPLVEVVALQGDMCHDRTATEVIRHFGAHAQGDQKPNQFNMQKQLLPAAEVVGHLGDHAQGVLVAGHGVLVQQASHDLVDLQARSRRRQEAAKR